MGLTSKMKQYKGNIYLVDDNFENKIIGATLTIDNDNFELEFSDTTYRQSSYKIIQGEFLDLGYVTLIDCIHSGNTLSIIHLTKYRIQHIITEIKFDDYNSIVATSLHIKMPSLNEWIRKLTLTGSLIFNGKIEYSKPEKILFFENNEYSVQIGFYLQENRNESITITQYCELEIKSKNDSLNVFELFNVYKKIKIFLGFIGVFSKQQDEFYLREENLVYEGQDEPITMKFLTKNFDTNNSGILTHIKINFTDIEGSINTILNNWLTNEKIQDSIILVMEKYTSLKLTVETYFLNTCFAIETFHRKNKFNTVFSVSDFNKIKRGIRSKLETDNEIKLFNDKLQFANEPTFKDRLISLKSEFESITFEGLDIEEYIVKIVKTRNYLVHRGSKNNIFNNLEMYYAAVYLEALTKFCIMETTGFEKELLNKIFRDTGTKINHNYELSANYTISKYL